MKYLTLSLFLLLAGNAVAQTSPDQWRSDIDFLRNSLLATHPALKNKSVAEPFQSRLDILSQRVAGHSDLDIALNLQAVVSAIGDDQTRLDLIPLLQKQNPIPFGLGWYGDGVYVSATTKRFQAVLGKKIVKVNGMDMEEVMAKAGRFVGIENAYTLRKDALSWLRFPAANRQAGIATSDTLFLTYEAQPGKFQTLSVYPLTSQNKADMQPAQIQPKNPDLRWQPLQYLFFMQYLEPDHVLYVQYNRCMSREMTLAAGDSTAAMQLPPFEPFADSLIHIMEKYPDAKLFLDLRFNPGGGSADGVALARRIADLPEINKKERLFVAVNLYTFSSAVQIAAVFDQLTNATIIGDQPAQGPNQYSETRTFSLPNSALKVIHSTRFIKMVDTNALNIDQTIEPSFDDFRNGKDPVLDFVRQLKQ